MDNPTELPDGRLVCDRHGLIICGLCCVDYSFMKEVLADSGEGMDGEDDSLSEGLSLEIADDPILHRRRGTGRVLPSKFRPPSTTSMPDELFPAGVSTRAIPQVVRFIRSDYPDQFLIFTDGACLNNGQPNSKAGWAFFFKPETSLSAGICSARLENKGPFGDYHAQTSNRAELRAVLAASRFRYWPGEGFTTLVFATDSEYVARGATEWVRGWVRNGWKTRNGADVKNKDLWELLLGELERWDEEGLKIQFWRIPRLMNTAADQAARQAAENEDCEDFCEIMGVLT